MSANSSVFIRHLITSLSRWGWVRMFGIYLKKGIAAIVWQHCKYFSRWNSSIPLQISTSHIRIPKIEKWHAHNVASALSLCALTNFLSMKHHWAPAKRFFWDKIKWNTRQFQFTLICEQHSEHFCLLYKSVLLLIHSWNVCWSWEFKQICINCNRTGKGCTN